MSDWEEIRKEGTRSYRVLPLAGKEENYRVRMLTENEMPGLIKPEVREKNGQPALLYDISGRTSLETWCKSNTLSSNQMEALIKAMGKAFLQAEDYMLEPDCFLLGPGDIYLDGEELPVFSPCFLCVAWNAGDWRERLRELLRYLLEKIDYREDSGVLMAYELYHSSCQENVSFEALEKCLAGIRLEESRRKEKDPEQDLYQNPEPYQKMEPYQNPEPYSKSERSPKTQRPLQTNRWEGEYPERGGFDRDNEGSEEPKRQNKPVFELRKRQKESEEPLQAQGTLRTVLRLIWEYILPAAAGIALWVHWFIH